jgi:hypothetical protein
MMNSGKEQTGTRRSRRCAAAVAILLIGLMACKQSMPRPGNADGKTSASEESVVATTATSAATTVGQTCTDAWSRRGHTTQREAKAFLTQCLAAQGVEGERLDPARVLALLEPAIPASSPLTSVVPVDFATFCPNYGGLDAEGRATFWRGLLLAMVGPESNFHTTTSLWEGGDLQQFSIGLLQLSYTDRRNYGCDFANEADIADPARNLACGVRIMTRLVTQNTAIGTHSEGRWLGGARYWSVLRTTSDSRDDIVRATSSLAVCQAN